MVIVLIIQREIYYEFSSKGETWGRGHGGDSFKESFGQGKIKEKPDFYNIHMHNFMNKNKIR